jgi:hypothetical protein
MKRTSQIRFTWLISLVVIALLAIPFTAFADDISNNLDASVDAVAEVMPLTLGGPNGTTQLYVVPRNDDSKNGCNFGGSGSPTLVVSVNSSNSSAATVSPSSVTFTSCDDTPTLTVTPVGLGSTTISLSQVSNSTGGSFNLAPATFTVNVVSPPNTAPNVTVTGVAGGASYPKGAVPVAGCQVTDAEDGNSSFLATLSAITGPYAADGIGEQTASCSYTDAGGLTATDALTYNVYDPSPPHIGYLLNPAAPDGSNGWYKSNVTLSWSVSEPESPNSLQQTGCVDQNITADQAEAIYECSASSAGGSAGPINVTIKRDATPPTISGSASPAANSGWNNTDVAVSFTCDDNLSGVASCGPDQTLSSEGAGQSATGTAVDEAGNSASDTVSGINIDKTAPTASAIAEPAANANGWNNSDVTVSFSGTDALSGIDSCAAPTVLSSEGAGQAASGTCTDMAGNVSASASASGINIDKTAPTVALVGGPTHGATYYYGFVPTAPTCSANDALSGLDGSCSLSGYSTGVGSHTVTASAIDKAGNSASASASYTVLGWTVSGFYQPVDRDKLNTVKGGSTVPLKFEIFAGSVELTDVSHVSMSATKTNCDPNASEESVPDLSATGATSLRYDTVEGQFIFNWKTPKSPNTCYKVTANFTDGSSITASFKLK